MQNIVIPTEATRLFLARDVCVTGREAEGPWLDLNLTETDEITAIFVETPCV